MAPDGGSRDVGRHTLGPHVVGRRVVVRRVLRGETGPSGGPALTDVLGVCTSWGGGACVVETDRGPVTIRTADIVSGKPVPPRPSVRQRITPAAAEAHVLDLWPHVEREPLGEWTLRSDPAPVGRPRRRVNSCLAMGDPGLPLAGAEQRIRDWYAARGRPVLAQVEPGSDVEGFFRSAGWEVLPGKDAEYRLAGLSRVARTLRGRGSASPVAEWTVDGPLASVALRLDGAVVARGHGALGGDWLGVQGLSVDAAHRRTGLGLRLMQELVGWGAEQGATTVWLHVETENPAAQGLYDALGFQVHHLCRYVAPPGTRA